MRNPFVVLLFYLLFSSLLGCYALNVPRIFRKVISKSATLATEIKAVKVKSQRFPKSRKLPNVDYAPLVGAFPGLRKDAAKVMLDYAEYCREHNLKGIRISLGVAGNMIFITDPKLLEYCMSDRVGIPDYPEGIFYKSRLDRRGVGLLTGEGVLLTDGPDHTRKRRLILPSMDTKSLNKFIEVMESVSADYAKNVIKNGPTNIPKLTSAIAMKIVGLCLFSVDVVNEKIYNDISICLDHVVYVTRHPFSLPQFVPTRRNRRFKKSLKKLDDLIFSFINQGQQKFQNKKQQSEIDCNNDNENNKRKPNDLLEMLLMARYEQQQQQQDGSDTNHNNNSHRGSPKLTDQELRDEVMTLFLAGHETTATALSWTIYYLSDPDNYKWQDLIAQEYDDVVNNHISTESGTTFSSESLQSNKHAMKYTRAVLCEALRLRTPSYAVDRQVQQTVQVDNDNILLKRGELILISPLAMHLNPNHFENPTIFDPSRFLTTSNNNKNNNQDAWAGPFDESIYLPFGAGRKRCIGFRFAQWEMLIILSTIVKHHRIKRPSHQNDNIQWFPGITLKPDPNLELIFEPR